MHDFILVVESIIFKGISVKAMNISTTVHHSLNYNIQISSSKL